MIKLIMPNIYKPALSIPLHTEIVVELDDEEFAKELIRKGWIVKDD